MINIIVGTMNSGKTLRCTEHLFRAWANGKTVLVNYPVTFPHYLINKDWLIYMAKKGNKEGVILENIAIGLDELWIYFDSRKSNTDENTVSSYFFLQTSKDDTEIHITAQHNHQNEKRIRENAHRIESCSRVVYINNKFVTINEEKRILTPELQKRLYIKVVQFKKINVAFYTKVVPVKTVYIKAQPIFKLYDTKHKIVMET